MNNSEPTEVKKGRKKKRDSELYSTPVTLELSVDNLLELEQFYFKIKKRCLQELRRKPSFGLQKLCLLSLELFLKDKEHRSRIEELVMEHYRSQKQI